MQKTHLDTVLRDATDYLRRNPDRPLSLFEVASLIVLGNLDASDKGADVSATQADKYMAEMSARVMAALKRCPPTFTASQIAPFVLTEREMASTSPMVISRRLSIVLRQTLGPSRRLNGNSVWDRPLCLEL